MAMILSGSEVTKALNAKWSARAADLKEKGTTPTLAIVRVGERGDDLSYERGAAKRCAAIGIDVRNAVLPADAGTEAVVSIVSALCADAGVHGILVLRPLPKGIDDDAVRSALSPEKDVDGITDASLARLLSGKGKGMTPCTAQACMELLDHYGIECAGKRAVVVGRSLVVGKPAALLLTDKNTTVTLCHTKTSDIKALCRGADIVIAAAGRAGLLGGDYFSEGQIVIDVGINFVDGKLTGDVRFDEAEPKVAAITPVPGGVGTVTTSVLCAHTVEAAERAAATRNG